LSFAEKRGIAAAMVAITRRGGRNEDGDIAGRSMLDWLRLHEQSERAISNFWSVVLVSALNEELARIDARYGLDVFWKAFLASRSGHVVGIPRVPLGELYEGCRTAIERGGGEVLCRAVARELREEDGRISSVTVDGGRQFVGDFYVLAVPHEAAAELLPERITATEPQLRHIRNLQVSPITSVHFWFDRDVMADPFLTVIGRTTQWIFNKSRLTGEQKGGRYLQSVISASYELVGRSRAEIINLCHTELREVLPEAANADLLKATVVKETAATFSPQPGSDRWRPLQRTSVSNLFLAGDWTATGWPATMEGAVRSGYLACEAIVRDCGESKRFLRPDLPAEGVSRYWTRKAFGRFQEGNAK
jgi:squalene-associated FAD-dependent desaturase